MSYGNQTKHILSTLCRVHMKFVFINPLKMGIGLSDWSLIQAQHATCETPQMFDFRVCSLSFFQSGLIDSLYQCYSTLKLQYRGHISSLYVQYIQCDRGINSYHATCLQAKNLIGIFVTSSIHNGLTPFMPGLIFA